MEKDKGRLALGVIILAAGESTRMGRPKLLLPWGKTSIIGHLINQWQQLLAEQICVVLRSGDQPLNAELDRLGFPPENRIENPEPKRGMFSSIQCAANWNGWENDLNAWAVILGDQPHLQIGTLRELLAFDREHPDAICQPAHGGHARHPVLLPRPAFAELRRTRAENLKDFLRQTSCRLLEHPVEDPGLAVDLDRPEDYELAAKSWR
ncbi:MAG TPA: nucleotidyltransferase family protein [Candidatus Aquilonibacter sp.]|nr:nucleotidyltransferase family protein [Candidatus Aquilonibacter sp.]